MPVLLEAPEIDLRLLFPSDSAKEVWEGIGQLMTLRTVSVFHTATTPDSTGDTDITVVNWGTVQKIRITNGEVDTSRATEVRFEQHGDLALI